MVSYSKILVPIDFSDFSKSAFKYAVEVAEQHNSTIVLVYVLEPFSYPPDISFGQMPIADIPIEIHNNAREELENLITVSASNSKYEIVIKIGKPFYEIVETARDKDCDLIIISTHGSTGMEHILFGSTAEKVIRKAPCPVLVLRNPLKGFDYKK